MDGMVYQEALINGIYALNAQEETLLLQSIFLYYLEWKLRGIQGEIKWG